MAVIGVDRCTRCSSPHAAIASNEKYAVYWVSHQEVLSSPERTAYRSTRESPQQLNSYRQWVESTKGPTYLAWFKNQGDYFYQPGQLVAAGLRLWVVGHFDDGALYRVAAA
jgi:hypothetical protein